MKRRHMKCNPNKKYINFEDMHDDGIGGVTEITEAEFSALKPYRADLENCNPIPLDSLIETIMERDRDEDMDVDSLTEENSLLFRIC